MSRTIEQRARAIATDAADRLRTRVLAAVRDAGLAAEPVADGVRVTGRRLRSRWIGDPRLRWIGGWM